jgi:hypothetical protein
MAVEAHRSLVFEFCRLESNQWANVLSLISGSNDGATRLCVSLTDDSCGGSSAQTGCLIYVAGVCTMKNSVFVDNAANLVGLGSASSLTLINCSWQSDRCGRRVWIGSLGIKSALLIAILLRQSFPPVGSVVLCAIPMRTSSLAMERTELEGERRPTGPDAAGVRTGAMSNVGRRKRLSRAVAPATWPSNMRHLSDPTCE